MPVLDVTINPGDSVQQAQSIKQAVNGMAEAVNKFDQASGRLRDARGRFVALAGNAKSAQTAVSGMAQGSAQALGGMTQKTAAFGSALSGVKQSAVSSGQSVQSSIGGMTQKTNQFKSALSSLKRTMAAVFTVYAIKNVAQSFLETSTEMENYRMRLRMVIKDQGEADRVFGRMVTWAAEAPITTAEAIGAFVQMKAAAVANAEEATLAVANLASVMNRDMRDVAASMISGETGRKPSSSPGNIARSSRTIWPRSETPSSKSRSSTTRTRLQCGPIRSPALRKRSSVSWNFSGCPSWGPRTAAGRSRRC